MAEMVNLESSDTAKDNIEKLKDIFPDMVKDGKIDFKNLQLILGEEIDTDSESYKFEWVGKKNCYKTIQTPSNGTLKYVKEDSLNPDTNENLIIEGDNLEVLKLLQSSYKNSIKMIFIDPPYNTGGDFVYNDDFKTPLQNYFEITGQKVDGETTQSKKSKEGRLHTQWLNMMFPRLMLSKTLLSPDGIIFITLDDNEIHHLRLLLDTVFGEENFIGTIAWKKTTGDNKPSFAFTHDNIVMYGKSSNELPRTPLTEQQKKQYKNPDNDKRGLWAESDYRSKWTKEEREGLYYPIINPNTKEKIYPDTYSDSPRVWGCSEETHLKNEKEGLVWWGKNGKNTEPKKKRFLSEHKGANTRSVWDKVASNDEATKEVRAIFKDDIFSNPKPVNLLKKIINIQTNIDTNDIVLDFFAGSGTTGQAVLELNQEDGGNRKCILVQIPQPLSPNKKEEKKSYNFLKDNNLPTNIAEITKERLRRVINGYGNNPQPINSGFKVFKLDNSNYKINEAINVNKDSDKDEIIKKLRQQFRTSTVYDESMVDGYKEGDVIYENILKEGYSLNSQIEVVDDIQEYKIYKITDNVKKNKVFYITFDKVDTDITTHKEFVGKSNDTLFICFDNNLSDSDKQNLFKTFRLKTM